MFIGLSHVYGSPTLGPQFSSTSNSDKRYASQMKENREDFANSLKDLSDTDKKSSAEESINYSNKIISTSLKISGLGAAIITTAITLGNAGNDTAALIGLAVGVIALAGGAIASMAILDDKTVAKNYLKENFPNSEAVKSLTFQDVKENISSFRNKIFGKKNENDTTPTLK